MRFQRLLKAVTTKITSKQHMVDDETQQDLGFAADEQIHLRGRM